MKCLNCHQTNSTRWELGHYYQCNGKRNYFYFIFDTLENFTLVHYMEIFILYSFSKTLSTFPWFYFCPIKKIKNPYLAPFVP